MLGYRFLHRYSQGDRNVTLLISLVVLFVLYPVIVGVRSGPLLQADLCR